MRLDLRDDPSVVGISERLGIEQDLVIGKLHAVWSWASRHSSNGRIMVSSGFIDKLTSVAGFAAAMESVSWLATFHDHVVFPNWGNWLSHSAKARLGETLRKRAQRANQAVPDLSGKCPDNFGTKPSLQQRTAEDSGTESAVNTALGCAARTVSLSLTEGEIRECVSAIKRRVRADAEAVIKAGPLAILAALGCDDSFVAAVKRRSGDNGEVTAAFWPAMLDYARMPRRPFKPGGWWREALARHGLDVRK